MTGGQAPSHLPARVSRGYFYEPTVIGDVVPSMRIAQASLPY